MPALKVSGRMGELQIDVARHWLASQDNDDPAEYLYRRLEIDACSYLVQNVWRHITNLPWAAVADGLVAATSRSFELEPSRD